MATNALPASSSNSNAAQQVAQQANQQAPQPQQPPPAKKSFLSNPFKRGPKKAKPPGKTKPTYDAKDMATHLDAMKKSNGFTAGQTATRGPAPGQQNAQQNAQQPPAPLSTDETVVGQISEQFSVYSDPVDSIGGGIGDTGDYIDDNAEEGDSAADVQSNALGFTSSGMGVGTNTVSAVSGGVAFFSHARRFHNMRKARAGVGQGIADPEEQKELLKDHDIEMADVGLQTGGNGVQAVGGGLGAASSAGGLGADIASAADSSNDVAATAADAFGGLGDSIGAVAGSFQLLISGARLGINVTKNLRHPEDADWSAVAVDSLGLLKGFLSTANSTLGAISTFMTIAGAGAELANALPLVGACVNICIQALDIIIQVINFIKALTEHIQQRLTMTEMNKHAKTADDHASAHDASDPKNKSAIDSDKAEGSAFRHLSSISQKRANRQILPMVSAAVTGFADLISIGGSVLNIVGVATSPAYGAGVAIMAVGYGATATAGLIKLGTALAGPVQALVRKQKQFGRDVKAGDENQAGATKKSGVMASMYRKTGLVKAYNSERSTAKKQTEYETTVDTLYAMMSSLPAQYSDTDKERFEYVHAALSATGVKMSVLYAQTSEADTTALLITAMKQRG